MPNTESNLSAAAKSVPVVLLGVAFTCMSPVTEDAIAFSSAGVGPTKASSTVVLAAEDTNKGMSSVSDSKLKFGAASTGDKGGHTLVRLQYCGGKESLDTLFLHFCFMLL